MATRNCALVKGASSFNEFGLYSSDAAEGEALALVQGVGVQRATLAERRQGCFITLLIWERRAAERVASVMSVRRRMLATSRQSGRRSNRQQLGRTRALRNATGPGLYRRWLYDDGARTAQIITVLDRLRWRTRVRTQLLLRWLRVLRAGSHIHSS